MPKYVEVYDAVSESTITMAAIDAGEAVKNDPARYSLNGRRPKGAAASSEKTARAGKTVRAKKERKPRKNAVATTAKEETRGEAGEGQSDAS